MHFRFHRGNVRVGLEDILGKGIHAKNNAVQVSMIKKLLV